MNNNIRTIPLAAQRSYMKPKFYRPLKLIVHPTVTYDPLGIACEGIRSSIDILPAKFNVLETISPVDYKIKSYTGLHSKNSVGNLSFMFDADFIQDNRMFFSGVQDYVLMGGAINNCLKRTYRSIIALKTSHISDAAIELFDSEKPYYILANKNFEAIKNLGIVNHDVLNLHFNSETLYPHHSALVANSRFREKTGKAQYGSWSDVVEFVKPGFRERLHNMIYENIPSFIQYKLSTFGFDVSKYFNGLKMEECLSLNRESNFHLNIYYWSSVGLMAEHFRGQFDE